MPYFPTQFFPHNASTTFSSKDPRDLDQRLFDLDKLTRMLHRDNRLTIEGERKLAHYLLVFMWRLVLKSPMLFRVRDEYVEQVKVLEKFCCERQDEFNRKVCFENHLYEDLHVELFDDLNPESNMNENHPKIYSIANYFKTIIKKYTIGELCRIGTSEVSKCLKTKSNYFIFNLDGIRNLVLKYFEYTPSILPIEDQGEALYFTGMTALLEYFASELIEVGGNCAKDSNQVFITSSSFEGAIARDKELERTIFFNMSFLPIVDLNYFYGANQLLPPPIEVNEKVELGQFNFTQLPFELHFTILEQFYSMEELLEMRLVCKRWNYFIMMNDNSIWKKLICNQMIAEDLFRFCDSSFTVDELETFLRRGRDLKPLHFNQQVMNHFYDINNWKSLYFILVRRHLTFVRDLDLMNSSQYFEDYFLSDSYSVDECYKDSRKKLQIGVSTGSIMYTDFTKHVSVHKNSSPKVFIPKDHLSEFMKFGNSFMLIDVIDFSKLSSFISCRLLPKKGLLYCFYQALNQQAEFLFIDNISMESEQLIEFETGPETFKHVKHSNRKQELNEQILVNQPACFPFFYLQQKFRKHPSGRASYLAPSLFFNMSKENPESVSEIMYQDDYIVLLSGRFAESEYFSVYISREDLIARQFNNAKFSTSKRNIN